MHKTLLHERIVGPNSDARRVLPLKVDGDQLAIVRGNTSEQCLNSLLCVPIDACLPPPHGVTPKNDSHHRTPSIQRSRGHHQIGPVRNSGLSRCNLAFDVRHHCHQSESLALVRLASFRMPLALAPVNSKGLNAPETSS